MNYLLLFLYALLMATASYASPEPEKEKPAYQIFTKTGKPTTYHAMVAELQQPDVVLFGELHNDPIAHWLQLELTKDLHRVHQGRLVLGAEMFEADVQLVLDEYLAGKAPEQNFEQEARTWPNYKTDYKPVVRFAKENAVPVIATNVPRRYASLVAKEGLEALHALSPEAKAYMAPLPLVVDLQLPGYQKMLTMFGPSTHSNHKSEQVVQAQALKDATMAYFVLQQVGQGRKVLHLNGAYHSDNGEGIGWYLRQQQPDLKVRTISVVQQDEVKKLAEENRQKADFIIVVPSSMTRTH
jgi:uncharacterized iron-regulated protein